MKFVMKFLIVMALFLSYKASTPDSQIETKLLAFESKLEIRCLSLDEEAIYLVFDYDKIDTLIEEVFAEEKVEIEKESMTSFILVIYQNNELIKERFYLERGEKYEESN